MSLYFYKGAEMGHSSTVTPVRPIRLVIINMKYARNTCLSSCSHLMIAKSYVPSHRSCPSPYCIGSKSLSTGPVKPEQLSGSET